MVNKFNKCPLCHSAFKGESGMKWHLAHRHEIPNAFDALGKDYETKITKLLEENALLEKKTKQLKMELQQTKLKLIEEQGGNLQKAAEIIKMNNEFQIMALALAVRDCLLKEKLNIELPNPFK